MCVLYFFLCSNGHDSPGNPSQSSISQPVSRFSPVFPGPCWYPIHNTTLGSPLPACNPSILSNQSALFQQEHISTVTDGGFHNIWCSESGREGEKWVENEKKVWELSWSRCGMEILDQHHVLLSLSIQVSERAVSCQCLPATEWRLLAVMLLMFLTVTFVTALPHSFSLILCLSPTLTFFLSLSSPPTSCFLFPFPVSILFASFLPTSPVQQWQLTTAVRQQPRVQAWVPTGPLVAVVVKGPGVAPLSPVQVCSITYPTTNNTHITTLSPRTRATPTARPIQLWVQQISSFSLSLDVCPSLLACLLLSYLRILLYSLRRAFHFSNHSLFLKSISGCSCQGSSYAHIWFSFSFPLSSHPSFRYLIPLIFPFPTLFPLKPSLCISLPLTISSSLLPLRYLFLLPSLFSAT